MAARPLEHGLHVVEEDERSTMSTGSWHVIDLDDGEENAGSDLDESGLEGLRDEFVEAFNARDLESLLSLVAEDVECPDRGGDGAAVLAEQLEAIWERSPAAMLTRGFLQTDSAGTPVAVAWLPDEDGCWSRVSLVCFDTDGDVITVVTLPDDVDALDRAQAEDPAGDELDDWADWSRWDRGEETPAEPRR